MWEKLDKEMMFKSESGGLRKLTKDDMYLKAGNNRDHYTPKPDGIRLVEGSWMEKAALGRRCSQHTATQQEKSFPLFLPPSLWNCLHWSNETRASGQSI